MEDALSVSDSAGNGARSRRKRPTSSAARCVASAALPPLPNSSTLPPSSMQATTISASSAVRSGRSPSSSACVAATLSPMRSRTSCSSVRGSTEAREKRLLIDRPGRQAGGGELELGHRHTHLDQRIGDPVLALKGAEEQHVAAAPGAGHLPAQRALAAGGLIRLIDEGVAEAR